MSEDAENRADGLAAALAAIERGDTDRAPDDGTDDHPYRRIARAALSAYPDPHHVGQ